MYKYLSIANGEVAGKAYLSLGLYMHCNHKQQRGGNPSLNHTQLASLALLDSSAAGVFSGVSKATQAGYRRVNYVVGRFPK